jgi:hypothetical protein
LKALLNGEDDSPFAGRVCRITPTEVASVVPKGGPVCGAPTMEELAALAAADDAEPAGPPARVGYRGVYHGPRQTFIGSVAVWRQAQVASAFGLTPPPLEVSRPEDDIATLGGAAEALAAVPVGVMFFPISFSTLVKPRARAELLPHLEKLPRGSRPRLAVGVYDTPRAPSFSALSQIKRFLEPFFGRLDLRVTDPAFQIDELPPDLASSVTLVLPPGDEPTRLAAVSRFMREGPAYRRKQVWQGVADIRTRRELNHCIDLGMPFMTGEAVTDLLEQPVGAAQLPWLNLPLHDWSWPPRPVRVVRGLIGAFDPAIRPWSFFRRDNRQASRLEIGGRSRDVRGRQGQGRRRAGDPGITCCAAWPPFDDVSAPRRRRQAGSGFDAAAGDGAAVRKAPRPTP